MNGGPERIASYLAHIPQAIERVGRYTDDIDEVAFLRDERTQDAVIRNLEIIGEACRNIERADPTFAALHPELPLSIAYEMRNAFAHGYFKVDLAIVWRSIETDLPPLYEQVRALLETSRRSNERDDSSDE